MDRPRAGGLYRGGSDLRYWLRTPGDRRHWWFQHMGDMVGTAIAAVTAFLVLSSARSGLGPISLAVSLAPAAIGVPGLWLWRRHYRRRFLAAAAHSAGAPRPAAAPLDPLEAPRQARH